MSLERRLLVVTESLGVGGTESHLLRLLPCLSDLGWSVSVFCLSGRGERAVELESSNIAVLSPRWPAEEDPTSRRHPKRVTLAARSLFSHMRRWRPQIAHFYLPGPYVIGAPIALAQRVPVKLMSRRSLSDYQDNWPVVARIERALHKRMDMLIGNSQAVVAQLMNENVSCTPVRLIYNGVTMAQPAVDRWEARQKIGIGEGTLLAVVVANLIHYKGHVDLLMGFGSIAAQLPPDWQLLLAGRDEGQGRKLKDLARSVGIAEHVQFLGKRSDVSRLLLAADFGLLTSHEEGFSNVILEAMAATLPMIVTSVGGNPEAVVDGHSGLLVPPHSPNAIGEAVLRLANDRELRMQLGAAARERVKQEFSLQACVTAHAEMYDRLLTQTKQRGVFGIAKPALRPASVSLPSRRPLMLAYWGRYGALPQLTLELGTACQREQATISLSTSNELFHEYLRLGEAIFPVITYASALSAANYRAARRVSAALGRRLEEDGTRAFVTLMPHIWSPLVVPVLKRAGVRHTVIVHDADPHRGDSTALINRWLLREAISADQVITLTASVADRLIEKKLVPKDKIKVLFHPDLTYASPRKLSDGPIRVLFFGRILPYKGLGVFVDAMETLRQTGLPIEIGVFGKGDLGPELERLKRLKAEVLNQWIDPKQIATILARHDIMVVSHTEASQSGVIATAHGAGLPVIATPVGGLREQIVHEVTGLLTEKVTGKAVADAVRRVVEDAALLNKLRAGINATKKHRSVDEFLRALSEVALGQSNQRIF